MARKTLTGFGVGLAPITEKRYAVGLAAKRAELKTVRVLLIGFNPVVREGLQAILAMDYDIEPVPNAADANQALLQLKQASDQGLPIHVVLTEARTSTLDGIQATRLIKEQFPEVAVLVLTENTNDSHVIDAIHAGAALKNMSPEVLLRGMDSVIEEGTQISAEVLRAVVQHLIENGRTTLAERTAEAAHLTGREVDVLRLMGNGESNKIIATTLGITLDATKKHVRNVIDKLKARNRTHAAIIAAQAGTVGKPAATVAEAQSAPGLAA